MTERQETVTLWPTGLAVGLHMILVNHPASREDAMRLTSPARALAAGLIGLGLFTGACVERGRLYVQIGPPIHEPELRLVSPGPEYVWVDGYQEWTGSAYIWVPGRWVIPPRPHAVWVPGHWDHDRHGWFFIVGRWR
jgi:hypothetical protein